MDNKFFIAVFNEINLERLNMIVEFTKKNYPTVNNESCYLEIEYPWLFKVNEIGHLVIEPQTIKEYEIKSIDLKITQVFEYNGITYFITPKIQY